MNALTITHLTKSFSIEQSNKLTILQSVKKSIYKQTSKKHILKNISFSVEKGTIVGISGKNGAGKTTLFRCIAGIIKPDSGSILTQGKLTALLSPRIGWRERLTIEDNLQLFGAFLGMSSKNIQTKMSTILNYAELSAYRNTKSYELSQGMLARLAISLILQSQSDILLLDEVLEQCDGAYKLKVVKTMKTLAHEGTTILFVTHENALLRQITHTKYELQDGQLQS